MKRKSFHLEYPCPRPSRLETPAQAGKGYCHHEKKRISETEVEARAGRRLVLRRKYENEKTRPFTLIELFWWVSLPSIAILAALAALPAL